MDNLSQRMQVNAGCMCQLEAAPPAVDDARVVAEQQVLSLQAQTLVHLHRLQHRTVCWWLMRAWQAGRLDE